MPAIAKNKLKLENFTRIVLWIPRIYTRRMRCRSSVQDCAEWGAGSLRGGVQEGCDMGVGHTVGASGRDNLNYLSIKFI